MLCLRLKDEQFTLPEEQNQLNGRTLREVRTKDIEIKTTVTKIQKKQESKVKPCEKERMRTL